MEPKRTINLRPELVVVRSAKHFEAVVLDAVARGQILLQMKDRGEVRPKTEAARALGQAFGVRLLEQNISEVHFNRRRLRYHGRVKGFIEGLRAAGIKV